MNKIATIIAIIFLSFAIFLPIALTTPKAQAQSANYTIQAVNHKVQILYSGHVVIQDTIQLTGQTPSTFQIGFPYKYANYLLKGTAYDSNNQTLPITLGVQLQNKNGYYATTITLPQGASQTFTAVFTFSNGLLTTTSAGATLDFPAYPSLTTTTNQCNTTLILPSDASFPEIDKPDGAVNGTTYGTTNLAAFTYAPATIKFQTTPSSIQLINIPILTRQINIDPSGAITSTDNYRIMSNSTTAISSLSFNLPVDASNVVARDEFGRILTSTLTEINSFTQTFNVTLILSINSGESTQVALYYSLPNVAPQQTAKFALNLDLFPYFNYYVDTASVTITPPEGARITTPQFTSSSPSLVLTRNVFQESITVNRDGVSFIDSAISTQEVVQVSYDYSPLWIAFRPTIWTWAVAVVGCVLVALWKRPRGKAPSRIVVPKMGVGLSPEHVKSFIDSYEERNRIISEIRSLEARAQRGRMPRRRYKVQRKNLELRLNTLTHTINDLKEMFSSAGGSYRDLMKQVEVAEVEVNEVELTLQTIETRHEVGELPIEEYRKQLTELERRKKKAEATLSGLLLRLRQEIR